VWEIPQGGSQGATPWPHSSLPHPPPFLTSTPPPPAHHTHIHIRKIQWP
jgi:hypothetical protein